MSNWYALSGLPSDLMSTIQTGYRRLRTDNESTAFLEGREFFTFYQFDIASDATQVIKIVSTVDTIVRTFGASLILGELEIELIVGGTEGGTFGTSIPVFGANQMNKAPSVTPQITMSTGGTHTGGTVVDMLLLNAGSPARQANEISASEDLPIGFAQGTFYIRLNSINSANAQGIFRARWEERS